MNPNNNNNMNNQENVQAGGHTMMDYLCPNTTARESPIHVPMQAYEFEIKPVMLVNLPIFRGVQNENPYTHVELFEEIVSTIQFYEGLMSEQRQFVEALSNGRFLSKTPKETWAYFDELAANNQTWEMADTTKPMRAMGKYVLHDVGDDDVRTQLEKLTCQLEMLTTKKVHELTTSMGAAQNERRKFPSQPQPNPQGQHSVGSSNEGHMEYLKDVTTLRSGRQVDKTIYLKATNAIGPRAAPTLSHGKRPSVSEERNVEKDESVENEQVGGKTHEGTGVRNNGEGKNVDKESVETPTPVYHPPAPFPQRLQVPKKPNHNVEIYKLF
ncbi:hypothetical protein Acr_00g0021700 [Actinidia rufa]|uniref:Uncharacterized protein n=1 Tax=Actinidia rufa TaxID=165716 RepID=A0A7J0DCI4_9ERIC|nr:hypothetical protein Acr_00g0021700 [Actinidia rufa]